MIERVGMALKYAQEAITEGELGRALIEYLRVLNKGASEGVFSSRTAHSHWQAADQFVDWLKGDWVPRRPKPVPSGKAADLPMGGKDGPMKPTVQVSGTGLVTEVLTSEDS